MYSVGEAVIYGNHGVCKVKEITEMSFGNGSDRKKYYVLCPVSNPRSIIYVPTDNDALTSRIRPLLSEAEIDEIISSVPPEKLQWIASDIKRKEFCGETLKSGDRFRIMQMIGMLYDQREALRDQKKHFHVVDERFLKDATRLLHEEFAYVLGISPADVPEYISSRIKASS